MAKKPQFPNPEFWKAKDNIDWKKQGENLMVCMKIFAEMFKETDWNKFFEGQKNNAVAFADRVKEEFNAFMALDAANKKDVILNGERRLGRLYRKGAMATVRREWRGIKDTAYDFYEWARMWGTAR